MIELQAGGACYSWRLPPHRWLGGEFSVEARKEDCMMLWRRDCEGCCAHPMGAMKSNSSRARREGQQVIRPCQVLELVVSTPRGSVTCGSPLARGPTATLELVSTGTSVLAST